MTKVIQILHHSLTPFNLGVDPRFYEGDWHVRVAKEIAKRTNEYEVECWRPEKTFNKTFTRKDAYGITYKIFPSTCWTYALEHSIPLLKNLKKELIKANILVHLHGIYNLHTNLIASYLHGKCPIVAQSHGGKPSLIEFKKNFRAQIFHPLRLSLLLAQQFSFGKVDRFFVLSKEEEEHFSKMYGKGKVRIQPMGINLEEFRLIDKDDAREMLSLEKDKPYALYVGRLHDSKGLQYLMKAMKQIHDEEPSLQLIIVGDGPHKDKYKAMSRSIGKGECVTFKGWVKPDELLLHYNATDIFVFPTLGEPWGIVILEALACKKPVITTFTGCVPKLIEDFKDGLVITPMGNAEAIEQAIVRVLPRAGELSKEINRDKLKKYTWEDIIKNTLATYNKLLCEHYD